MHKLYYTAINNSSVCMWPRRRSVLCWRRSR